MRARPRTLLLVAVAGALVALVAAVALAVSTGGSSAASSQDRAVAGTTGGTAKQASLPRLTGAAARGRALFTTAGCAGCHTLRAAGSSGTVGPDLDVRAPTVDRVVRQVTRGGLGMPSFGGRLSPAQIADVAAFIAKATSSLRQGPVVTVFRPDSRTLDGCAPGDTPCTEQAFGNLAYRDGAKPALDLFARKMQSDTTVESDCHRIAHSIGAATLARDRGNTAQAMTEGSSICWSGFYHGVLERSFAGVSDRRLGAVTRRLCTGPAVQKSLFVLYQCVHGLGHGLMIHTGYDLPLALRTCDKLATDWDRSSCTGGVFMENISSSYGVKSRWLRDDDLLYPCPAVASRHKLYCYLMVTSRVLEKTNYDWDRAVSECRRAEKAWVATCFQSYGRDASGNSRQDPERIAQLCAKAGDMEVECYFGASRDVTSNDAGGARAKLVCERGPEGVRARCWEGIGTIIGTLQPTAAGRQAVCRELSEQYLADCARGSGAPVAPPVESAKPST